MQNNYDLETQRVVEHVKQKNAKRVLIQLPDGLKPFANTLVDELTEKTGAEFLIWSGSCFGACDLPTGLEILNIDLVVSYGHSAFHRTNGWSN